MNGEGLRASRFLYPVLSWLSHFFILPVESPFRPFFFFLLGVVLPSPGKIDGPEGFKRIKLYPNTPKTFRFRIDSFSSNVGQ